SRYPSRPFPGYTVRKNESVLKLLSSPNAVLRPSESWDDVNSADVIIVSPLHGHVMPTLRLNAQEMRAGGLAWGVHFVCSLTRGQIRVFAAHRRSSDAPVRATPIAASPSCSSQGGPHETCLGVRIDRVSGNRRRSAGNERTAGA